jgi:hypothetical protein
MKQRITESELILPSLFLMSLTKNGIISTTELRERLKEILKPTGEDAKTSITRKGEILFDQIVRNLICHKTFLGYGYSTYYKSSSTITTKGRKYLQDNLEIVRYFLGSDFNWEDVKKGLKEIVENGKKKAEFFDENIIIHEGLKKYVSAKVYERSKKLRDAAIEYFTKNGHIGCITCQFDFENFYGQKIGKDFIEIHHTKPVFKYKEVDLKKTIEEALKNIVPVCSNCHRMIHKNWAKPLEIKFLIGQIEQNGVFERE